MRVRGRASPVGIACTFIRSSSTLELQRLASPVPAPRLRQSRAPAGLEDRRQYFHQDLIRQPSPDSDPTVRSQSTCFYARLTFFSVLSGPASVRRVRSREQALHSHSPHHRQHLRIGHLRNEAVPCFPQLFPSFRSALTSALEPSSSRRLRLQTAVPPSPHQTLLAQGRGSRWTTKQSPTSWR